MMTLFGWDMDTWQRACEWAGEAYSEVIEQAIHEDYDRVLAIRERWRLAGGPEAGPSGRVLA